MALKKAMIFVERGTSEEKVEVLFNPNQYSLQTANRFSWQNVPGLSVPVAQYVGGEATSLSMELFFDTFGAGTDVREYTSKITSLLDVDSDLHAPPILRFVWGTLNFRGVLENVQQRFTMFLDSGIPVRATLSVSLKEYQTMKEQYQRVPRQSADRTKQKQVKQGEQLWMIANQEYEDAGLWREIARANGIHNPRDLQPGRSLTVPRLE